MAGFDFRTKPETADTMSFYIFDNLKMQESGEGGNVYRFDTMQEAIIGWRMIQAEHSDWRTALGGSVGGEREIDFIQVREGGANVLIDDFKRIDFWKDRPDVARAIEEFAAGPGIEWQTDRALLGDPILVPYAPESPSEDPFLADKALLPTNPEDALTSVSEAYVQGQGWVDLNQLKQLIRDHGSNPDERPRVSRLNVAYETTGKGNVERGRTGYVDIKPHEMYGMVDRFRELMGIRDQEREERLAAESQIDPPASEEDFPEFDMGRPFFDYETSYGETERVCITIGAYAHDENIYLGMDFLDRDLGAMDFYGDITVNITKLQPFMACIDTNNNGDKIVEFLVNNDIAVPTGRSLPSGFCMYPVFRLNKEKLAQADPGGFRQYCQIAGIEPKQQETAKGSLDDLKREARNRAADKNLERPDKQHFRHRGMEL